MALIIEPFYGGSHKQLIDKLKELENIEFISTLPAKKWHWRARTSALYFSQQIPKNEKYRTLFTSSVLNLAELIALRNDLSGLRKVIYFHENQLCYPIQKQKERDFQYGYNQVLSCLVADCVIFNSKYNMESFLNAIPSFFNIMPDFRPKNLVDEIRPKCQVLYFPLEMNISRVKEIQKHEELHIVWPHRWEHDKNPELFFKILFQLKTDNIPFKLSVLGEIFQDVPAIFNEAKEVLKDEIINWGYKETKQDYYNVLYSADVVISTANHEFFGVSMLEATMCGCFPLCPNKLVYPEIFPNECLYNTETQLHKKLKNWCKNVSLLRKKEIKMDFTKFSWHTLKPQYQELLCNKSLVDQIKSS